MSFRYILDPSPKKYICPECQKKRFVRYVDSETGSFLSGDFGRCDRKDNCTYHKAPPKGKLCFLIHFLAINSITAKAYLATDPNGIKNVIPKSQIQEKKGRDCWVSEWYLKQGNFSYLGNESKYFQDKAATIINTESNLSRPESKPSFHGLDLINDLFIENPTPDNFTYFLFSHFENEKVKKAIRDYFLTGTGHYWHNSTVFWQIDEKERVHSGKIMHYNPNSGKRTKKPYSRIGWMHKALKADGFNLNQCLFGMHLLNTDYEKRLAIVESEKTAVIMSIILPDFLWMATGGHGNLNIDKIKELKKRDVILYPDLGSFHDWEKQAATFRKDGFKVTVSKIIEDLNDSSISDLADYYLIR